MPTAGSLIVQIRFGTTLSVWVSRGPRSVNFFLIWFDPHGWNSHPLPSTLARKHNKLTCEVVPPVAQSGYSKSTDHAASMNQSVGMEMRSVMGLDAYNNPIPKMPETAIFRFRGIWSPQTMGTGNNKIVRSMAAFTAPTILAKAKLGRQKSIMFQRWSTLCG